ncbi:MAG: BACON domain-containing protein [Acidobacteriota bacterium]
MWTQEYLRYRVSSCSHLEAVDKVIAQIDGRGVQPDCTPVGPPPPAPPPPAPPPSPPPPGGCGGPRPSNCDFQIDRTAFNVPSDGGTFDVNVGNEPRAACPWSVTGAPSWITVLQPAGEVCATERLMRFRVAANTAGARSATLTVAGKAAGIAQAGGGVVAAFGQQPRVARGPPISARDRASARGASGCRAGVLGRQSVKRVPLAAGTSGLGGSGPARG